MKVWELESGSVNDYAPLVFASDKNVESGMFDTSGTSFSCSKKPKVEVFVGPGKEKTQTAAGHQFADSWRPGYERSGQGGTGKDHHRSRHRWRRHCRARTGQEVSTATLIPASASRASAATQQASRWQVNVVHTWCGWCGASECATGNRSAYSPSTTSASPSQAPMIRRAGEYGRAP